MSMRTNVPHNRHKGNCARAAGHDKRGPACLSGAMSLTDPVAQLLGQPVRDAVALSGGDLSTVLRVTLADGRIAIVKQGATARAEADMLRAIAATGAPAPVVLAVGDDLLAMTSCADRGGLSGSSWDSLAGVLARLHGVIGDTYGWPVDHAFGPVAIPNGRRDDWPTFWADNRLRCHLPHVAAGLGRRIERLADRLPELLPAHPPAALLHGDLWGGNVLVADGAVSALIDPACYHGDREVDVAMLTLFDRPPAHLFEALGLEAGWRERAPIYRLWPLLVHLRLFGDGYRGSVEDALVVCGL